MNIKKYLGFLCGFTFMIAVFSASSGRLMGYEVFGPVNWYDFGSVNYISDLSSLNTRYQKVIENGQHGQITVELGW